jgi:hypothetical protein
MNVVYEVGIQFYFLLWKTSVVPFIVQSAFSILLCSAVFVICNVLAFCGVALSFLFRWCDCFYTNPRLPKLPPP